MHTITKFHVVCVAVYIVSVDALLEPYAISTCYLMATVPDVMCANVYRYSDKCVAG